jgi:hypothetical protein
LIHIREVVRNEIPFPSLKSHSAFREAWLSDPPEVLINLLASMAKQDTLLSKAAFEILTLCWKYKPADRPRMTEAQARYQQKGRPS